VTLVTPISAGCTVEKHLRYAFVQGRSNTPPSPCPVSITSACNDFVDSLRAAQSCGKARNEARAPTHRRKGIRLGREILDWACFGAGCASSAMSNLKLMQILCRPPGRSPLPLVVVSVKRSAFGVLGREILDWACFGAGTLDGIFAPFPLEMLDLVAEAPGGGL